MKSKLLTELPQLVNPGFDTLFSGSGVLEAPTWDGAGGVYFTNVTAGGVYRLDLITRRIDDVAPHRKGIGGLALTQDGSLIVSGRNVALKRSGGDTQVLLDGERLGREISVLMISPWRRMELSLSAP